MRTTVIGAGIIGLTCALRLADAGHRVRVLSDRPPAQSTSAVAAAIWYPYRAFPRDAVTRWSARTYEVLCGLADVPGTGVRLRAGRELFRAPAPDPWWRSAVPTLARVADPPAGYADGIELTLPVVDMTIHLGWLTQRLTERGVEFETGHVTRLSEVDGVVIDCTGLGARELLGDRTLVALRGQVVVVEQTGLHEWVLDQDGPTYVVPREHSIVLGGTDQEADENLTADPATAADIVARCAALVPEVAGARVLAHRVGLRPTRPSVRLERVGDVVHCYGHGGAGVTLSYGCAEEVLALLHRPR